MNVDSNSSKSGKNDDILTLCIQCCEARIYISSISFMGHSQCWQGYYLANDGLILCFTRHHFNIEYFNCYLAASSRSVDISIISMYSTTPQSGSTLESSSMLKDRDSQNIQPHCPASAEENNKKTCCY